MSLTRSKKTLVLGTANFGMPYGLGALGKNLELLQVVDILETAKNEGFLHLDTASSYEGSEKILGNVIPKNDKWKITTKLKQSECVSAGSIVQAVKKSLERTKQKKFWSVLLHHPQVLFESHSDEVLRGLREVLDLELTQHVGISAYEELEIVQAKTVAPFLTAFQISENICNQRMATSSNLIALASENNYIFVRSIFLQGLLLMDPHALPSKVASAKPSLHALRVFCENLNLTSLELCIGYAKSLTWSSGLIFGVNSQQHVLDISKAFNSVINVDYSKVPKFDDWLLDPRNWS